MRAYESLTMRGLALSLACMVSSCGGEAGPPDIADAIEAPGGSVGNPPAVAAPVAASPLQAPPLFSGQALTAVLERGLPGGVALQGKVDEIADMAAIAEECHPTARPGDTFLIDMNGDGRYEGISVYTLSQCSVGKDVRILAVLQQDAKGQWTSILESALTVGNEPARDIMAIDSVRGIITVQGAFDQEAGRRMEPEVISVSQLITPN